MNKIILTLLLLIDILLNLYFSLFSILSVLYILIFINKKNIKYYLTITIIFDLIFTNTFLLTTALALITYKIKKKAF
ncbi:MAG: hypothetical protein RR359_02590 [Bacilli bacterium]